MAQGFLILRRLAPGVVEAAGPCPEWVSRIPAFPGGSGAPFELASVFPYLEIRIPELEAFWADPENCPMEPSIWTEPTSDGGDLHLKVLPMLLPPDALLVVREAGEEHEALQKIHQSARMLAMEHDRLLAAQSEREILLHCVIHDLAGPLSGIQGCLDLLAQTQLAPADAELVRMAQAQTARQQRLIRDLLDVYSSHLAPFDPSSLDPREAPDLLASIHDVVRGLSPASALRKVHLHVDVLDGGTESWTVLGESSRLERILYNLIENALRFAPRDSTVTIQVARESSWLRATVIDQGPGIHPDVLPRLFHRFVSGGKSPGKSGLGLYFCRIALERWGGSISCESGCSPGARFTIRLRALARAAG